jgi:ankyrin repeat protein
VSTRDPLPLPDQPDLRHLRDQARDLRRQGRAGSLAEAQVQVARRYGFPSWPKLKAHVESLREVGQLKAAIDANDLERVKALMTRKPALHRAPLGYGNNGPLTWVAECRGDWSGPPPPDRLEMARWMIAHGSDVHQGGDGPLMRAALSDHRLPMAELLVAHGADVNARWDGRYPILCAPCETLAPRMLQWLIERGADPRCAAQTYGSPLAMTLGTYSRNAKGRQACLAVLDRAGLQLPDTPVMALHAGRLARLEESLRRQPRLLARRFAAAEIYPPAVAAGRAGDGLTSTPVDGVTLLHLAIEYNDLETAAWLVERGADVNARAAIDDQGFGGHPPLFHAVVTMGSRVDATARLLLERGADANLRATLRKQLRDMGDPEKEQLREFRNVTATGYARQYVEPRWVNEPALAAIASHGGSE